MNVRSTKRAFLLPILVLAFGVFASFVAWIVVDQQIHEGEQLRFERYSDRILTTIKQRLLDHERLLEGGKGLFYASESVTADEWRAYVSAQKLDLYPGILGFGYIASVPRASLSDYVAMVRKEQPDFKVKSKSDKEDLFVIQQIEPKTRNLAAWGFDVGQEVNRREAAEAAARSGDATLTRKITLVQDQKKIAGFLMLLPLYKSKTLPEFAARKGDLQGWTYVPIRAEELMEGVVAATENMVNFKVSDGESEQDADLIYDGNKHRAMPVNLQDEKKLSVKPVFEKNSKFEAHGRTWTVLTSSRPEFEHAAQGSAWVFFLGFCLTALAAATVWVLSNARRNAEVLADAMTIEVRQREERWQLAVKGSHAGIWDWDIRTGNVYYSPRWLEILGLSDGDRVVDRLSFLKRLHPDDLPRVQTSLQAHFRHMTPTYAVEYRVRHNDGEYRWVTVNGLAGWDENDQPVRIVGSMIDITHRKQVEADLRDSEGLMRAVVDSTVDGIMTMDETGAIQSFNRSAEVMFGYDRPSIVGKNVGTLLSELDRSHLSIQLPRFIASDVAKAVERERELKGHRKDGSVFPVEMSMARIIVKEKIMLTCIVRDIAERQKIDRMKREFVSTVSHELRTPLTSICGSLGLIAGGAMGEVSGQVRQLINIAYNNSERLIRLINDILDIDKIESGKIAMAMRVQPMMGLIEQALEENRGYAEQYGVRFELAQRPIDVDVDVDSDRFMQVMANLLSNAAKFSPREEVVNVDVVVEAGEVRVSVTDHGSGIPETFRDKIFQKFTQADSSDTRQKGGTGLGLAICKALIECMNGTMGYKTEINRGTTFYFSLPRVVESAESLRSGNAHS